MLLTTSQQDHGEVQNRMKIYLNHATYRFYLLGCWVRYGYDPRKDPMSKKYQMIDYRLRYYAEPEINLVKPKPRSAYHKRKFQRYFILIKLIFSKVILFLNNLKAI